MTLRTGQDIVQGDFIKESEKNSTPANDADRVPRLETNGKVSPVYLAPVIAKQMTQQNSPASTTETTILSYTVAAGVLATTNGLRYRAYVETDGGGVSATTTIRLKLGGTTVITITPATGREGFIEIVLFNTSASAQIAFAVFNGWDGGNAYFLTASGSGAENTTSSKTLTVTAQLSNASGAYAINMQTVEVL